MLHTPWNNVECHLKGNEWVVYSIYTYPLRPGSVKPACKKSLTHLLHCLLHLVLSQVGDGSFKVVHNTLKAVAFHYFPFMAAQQTQGYLKDHFRPLDKQEVCKNTKSRMWIQHTLPAETSPLSLLYIHWHSCKEITSELFLNISHCLSTIFTWSGIESQSRLHTLAKVLLLYIK